MGIRFNIPRPLPKVKVTPTPPKFVAPLFTKRSMKWQVSSSVLVTNDGYSINTQRVNAASRVDTPLTMGGKFYYEMRWDGVTNFGGTGIRDQNCLVGLVQVGGTSLVASGGMCLVAHDGRMFINGNATAANGLVGTKRIGSTFMFAADTTARKYWVGMNGVWLSGATNADIVAGLKPSFIWPNASVLYPAVHPNYGGSNIMSLNMTLVNGQEAYLYTPPVGFGPPGTLLP